MSEREGFISKLLVPDKHRPQGWATRLFLACTLATGLALYTSRNQSNSSINIEQLSKDPEVSLRLSSDGKHLAYIGNYVDQEGNAYQEVREIDQYGNEKAVFNADGSEHISDFSWQPNGNELAINLVYSSDPYWGGHHAPEQGIDASVVYIINSRFGGAELRIAGPNGLSSSHPKWSSDGKELTFQSNDQNYSVDSDGANLQSIYTK